MCARWLIQDALEVVSAGDNKADLPSAHLSVWWKCRISVCGTATIVLWPSLFRYNALRQLALTRSFLSDHISSFPSACATQSGRALKEGEDPQVSRVLRPHKTGPSNKWSPCSTVCITKETRYLFPSFISAGAFLSLPASLRFSSAKRCQKLFCFELSVILVLTISTEILKLLVVPAPGFLFTTCGGQIPVLKFRLTALKMTVL